MEIPSFALKGGAAMPAVGLGTWQLTGKACEKAVRAALGIGYAHIDTAEIYGNEREIGRAIRGHDRSRLFITSKVWRDNLSPDDVIAACGRSLEALGTGYLDLYLIHWPNSAIPVAETLRALKELQVAGKVRAIGVSNFTVAHLEEALKAGVDISVNQVEFHPGLCQPELLAYCEEHGILLTAYSPLGRDGLLSEEAVVRAARKHGKTPAQACLRWAFEKGCVAIPKATSEEHLRANIDIFGFGLDAEDTALLDSLPRERLVKPGFAEFDE